MGGGMCRHISMLVCWHFTGNKLVKQCQRVVFVAYGVSACWHIRGLELWDMDGGGGLCMHVGMSACWHVGTLDLKLVNQGWRVGLVQETWQLANMPTSHILVWNQIMHFQELFLKMVELVENFAVANLPKCLHRNTRRSPLAMLQEGAHTWQWLQARMNLRI